MLSKISDCYEDIYCIGVVIGLNILVATASGFSGGQRARDKLPRNFLLPAGQFTS